MSTQTLITAVEFEKMAARLGPCELVRGEVIPLSPGGMDHSQISAAVVGLLYTWTRSTKLGRVWTNEAGLITQQQPDTVRGIDAAYYAYERLPRQAIRSGFAKTPPNLAVEILGKGQGWREMLEKVGEYLRLGVDRVWLVDPKTQRVHIYRPDAEPVVLSGDDALVDDVILPGFRCTVADLFQD
jgi:Uma2 family endonuclease